MGGVLPYRVGRERPDSALSRRFLSCSDLVGDYHDGGGMAEFTAPMAVPDAFERVGALWNRQFA